MVLIRKLQKNDIPEVGRIHFKYLKEGIIANLGNNFLEKFYNKTLTQKNIFTFVAGEKGKIVGFATGALKLEIIPMVMFKNLWLDTLIAIVKNPLLFFKLVETPFYPNFKSKNDFGEIFTIAVLPEYRNHGIGTNLIKKLKSEFKKNNCKYFQVSVREKMRDANSFYQNLGLKKKTVAKFLGEDVIFYEGRI